jgi:hypothetical protein
MDWQRVVSIGLALDTRFGDIGDNLQLVLNRNCECPQAPPTDVDHRGNRPDSRNSGSQPHHTPCMCQT